MNFFQKQSRVRIFFNNPDKKRKTIKKLLVYFFSIRIDSLFPSNNPVSIELLLQLKIPKNKLKELLLENSNLLQTCISVFSSNFSSKNGKKFIVEFLVEILRIPSKDFFNVILNQKSIHFAILEMFQAMLAQFVEKFVPGLSFMKTSLFSKDQLSPFFDLFLEKFINKFVHSIDEMQNKEFIEKTISDLLENLLDKDWHRFINQNNVIKETLVENFIEFLYSHDCIFEKNYEELYKKFRTNILNLYGSFSIQDFYELNDLQLEVMINGLTEELLKILDHLNREEHITKAVEILFDEINR